MKDQGESLLNILTIDTSTDNDYLCICSTDKTPIQSTIKGLSHSNAIFENLESLLSESGLSIDEINLIAAGRGPGSFTGVRIGLTTARTLAQILSIPLIGFISHELYAASAADRGYAQIITALDAKKKRVFGAAHSVCGVRAESLVPAGDYPPEELLKKCDPSAKTLCAGDGCSLYAEKITSYFDNCDIENEITLSAEKTAEFVREKAELIAPGGGDYREAVPFYARLSDAEVAKRQKETGAAR